VNFWLATNRPLHILSFEGKWFISCECLKQPLFKTVEKIVLWLSPDKKGGHDYAVSCKSVLISVGWPYYEPLPHVCPYSHRNNKEVIICNDYNDKQSMKMMSNSGMWSKAKSWLLSLSNMNCLLSLWNLYI